uniref:Uncharacterized protein n=1 Tax=Lygus hesperus TaxID=30085 RepID=A0A0K8T9F2_LYGHE
MLKIITLLVVVFAVILLHGVYGRSVDDDVTTKRPKLIRVPLKRYDPLQTLDVMPVSRHRRGVDVEVEIFDFKRGPLDSNLSGRESGLRENSRNDDSRSEEFFRGFEAEEREEKLAASEADDQISEVTEGRTPTDDEKQRFDVESSTLKIVRRFKDFEELSIQKLFM